MKNFLIGKRMIRSKLNNKSLGNQQQQQDTQTQTETNKKRRKEGRKWKEMEWNGIIRKTPIYQFLNLIEL